MARTPVWGTLAGMIAWVALNTFQFGFGISELNAIETQFTCQGGDRCLGMSQNAFGMVTTMFTVGGTFSSLLCGSAARYAQIGRKHTLQVASSFSFLGSLLLCASSSLSMLAAARFLQGIGAGIGIVQVPMYLQEISPPSLSGQIGILNQVAIVVGIFSAQLAGTMAMSAGGRWWRVPEISAAIAAVQLVVGTLWAYESPGWLEGEGAHVAAQSQAPNPAAIRQRLWGVANYEALQMPAACDEPNSDARNWRTSPQFRRGIWIVALTQMAQQFSGVNAILYYSTGILSKLMPQVASRVGLLITVVNGLLTFPPIVLISEERLGRKKLLVGSAAGMGVFSLLLAYSLWSMRAFLSAVAILCVIACFSMGLGPVPFVIMPEVLPAPYVSIGSSFGLAINWASNIVVAASFAPLRSALGIFDGHTGGLVFVVFGATNLAFAFWMARDYHYEEDRTLT